LKIKPQNFMIEIGIVSDEISLDVEEAIKIGLKLGIKSYELRCVGSYEKRVPYIERKDIDFIKRNLDDGKIKITALSPGIFKIRASEKEKLKFELEQVLPDTFKLATELGVDKIIIFGFVRDGTSGDEIVEILKNASMYAKQEKFNLLIENEPGFYCDTGENTAKIIDFVRASSEIDNLWANWDPANAVGAGEFAFPNGYEKVKNFIKNLHVKDSVNFPKFKCTLIGEGAVNWYGQLMAIIKDKIIQSITLETHHLPLVESTIEDLKRLRAILKAIEESEYEG